MADVKWLDSNEQEAWVGLIATLSLLDTALDRQLQLSFGLSHAHYGILARLSEAPDRTMHMNALAALTSSSQSRLSHMAARLEDRGWLFRSRCPQNRRAVHVTLTESGYELVRRAAPGHVGEVRRLLFDHLSRDQVQGLVGITRVTLKVMSDEGYDTPRM